MNKLIHLLLVVLAAMLFFIPASADTSEDYSYTTSGTSATITGYSGSDANMIIPNSFGEYIVTSIAANAFENNISMQTVSIPDTVTQIGTYAFSGCSGLKEVTLPAGIDTIRGRCFQNCTSLSDVTIPNNVSSIATGAFSGCTSLVWLELPPNIDTIGTNAFPSDVYLVIKQSNSMTREALGTDYEFCEYYQSGSNAVVSCYNTVHDTLIIPDMLSGYPVVEIQQISYKGSGKVDITLPDQVGSVNSFPADCVIHTTLGSVTSHTLSDAGYTFFKPGDNDFGCRYLDGLLYLVLYQGDDDVLEIPEGIEGIGYVFADYNMMTSFTFPSTLKVIGYEAFRNCSGLTSITIPSTVEEIGFMAFAGSAIRNITIPDNVKVIGQGAFQDCSNLAAVTFSVSGGDGVTSIADSAFQSTALRRVTIPSTCISLGAFAFSNNSQLTSVTVPANGVLHSVGSYAFQGSGVTTLTLPGTITRLGDYSFSGMTSLEEVILSPGTVSIENGCFYGDYALKRVTLNTGLISIGEYAFGSCGTLEEIILPNGLEEIGPSAFYGTSFSGGMIIPDTVTSLGTNVFRTSSFSKGITLSTGLTSLPAYAFADSCLTEIQIPDSITSIENNAFSNSSYLTDVELSSNLKTIGTDAFLNCYNMTWLELPDTMTSLSKCLDGCSNVIVVLPDSIRYIDGIVFKDVRAVLGSRSNESLKSYDVFGYSDERTFLYSYIDEEGIPGTELRVVDYIGENETDTFPTNVYIIADEAFANSPLLRMLALPDNLIQIGENVFHHGMGYTCTPGSNTEALLIAGGYRVEVSGYPGLFAITDANGNLSSADYYGTEDIFLLPDNIVSTASYASYTDQLPSYGAFSGNTIFVTTSIDTQTAHTFLEDSFFRPIISFLDKEEYGYQYVEGIMGNHSYYAGYALTRYYGTEQDIVLPADEKYVALQDPINSITLGDDVELFDYHSSIKIYAKMDNTTSTFRSLVNSYYSYNYKVYSKEYPDLVFKFHSETEDDGIALIDYTGTSKMLTITENMPFDWLDEATFPKDVTVYCDPASTAATRIRKEFYAPGDTVKEYTYKAVYNDVNFSVDAISGMYLPCLIRYNGTLKDIIIPEETQYVYFTEVDLDSITLPDTLKGYYNEDENVKIYCKPGSLTSSRLYYYDNTGERSYEYSPIGQPGFVYKGGYSWPACLIRYEGTDSEIFLPEGTTNVDGSALPSIVKTIHMADSMCEQLETICDPSRGYKIFASIGSNVARCMGDRMYGFYTEDYPDIRHYQVGDQIQFGGYTGSEDYFIMPPYFDYTMASYEPNGGSTGFGQNVRAVYYYLGTKSANWIQNVASSPIPLNGTPTLLPSGLSSIEEEAFAGSSLVDIRIPSGPASIGSKAFANCNDLRIIRIPSSVTSIADNAFEGCSKLLFITNADNTAVAQYAKEHDIVYYVTMDFE